MNGDNEMQSYRSPFIWMFAAIVIGIISLIVISAVFGRFSSLPYYPPFFFFPFWFIFPLFFFGLFFIFAFRWRSCWWGSRGYYYNDPALETLRERFARGEITKEQYDEMRKNLEQH